MLIAEGRYFFHESFLAFLPADVCTYVSRFGPDIRSFGTNYVAEWIASKPIILNGAVAFFGHVSKMIIPATLGVLITINHGEIKAESV